MCLCYISTKESTFSKRNNENLSVLENIEQDISRLSTEGAAIIIGGLNAHINPSKKDYVESDSLFQDALPSSYICDSVLSDRHMIKMTSEPMNTGKIYSIYVYLVCVEY